VFNLRCDPNLPQAGLVYWHNQVSRLHSHIHAVYRSRAAQIRYTMSEPLHLPKYFLQVSPYLTLPLPCSYPLRPSAATQAAQAGYCAWTAGLLAADGLDVVDKTISAMLVGAELCRDAYATTAADVRLQALAAEW